MVMRVERLTLNPGDAFDVDTVQFHLRAESSDFQAEVTRMARAAQMDLEAYASLALLTQQIRVTHDSLPRLSHIPLPIAPLLSSEGATVTIGGEAVTGWQIITGLRSVLVLTGYPDQWPDALFEQECVVEYDAGFGDSRADVPPDMVHAIMDQTAMLFDDKGGGHLRYHTTSPHFLRIAGRYRRVAI